MMRSSRRFEGHIWLAGYSGEADVPWAVAADLAALGFAHCLERLGRDYGLVTVFERDGDEYRLRCYPLRIGGAGDLPQWAASYSSTFLEILAAAALTDYSAVAGGCRLPIFSRGEFERWVR